MTRPPVLPTTINRPNGEPLLVFHPLMHPGEPLEIEGEPWRVISVNLIGDEYGTRQTLTLESVAS
jgi:hypothetical protein